MAIADYTSLRSALQTWAARSDSVFANQIPTFVELAEARIYDGAGEPGEDFYSPPLRSKALEITASVVMTDGAADLPTEPDVLEVRRIWLAGAEWGTTFLPPERFAERAAVSSAGPSLYHTIEDTRLRVFPAFTGDVELLYFARHPAVTVEAPAGPTIEAHGTIYLEACLLEAFSFMQEMELAALHMAKLRSLIAGANRTASKFRSPGPLRVQTRMVFP